jgi:hypothetical protein
VPARPNRDHYCQHDGAEKQPVDDAMRCEHVRHRSRLYRGGRPHRWSSTLASPLAPTAAAGARARCLLWPSATPRAAMSRSDWSSGKGDARGGSPQTAAFGQERASRFRFSHSDRRSRSVADVSATATNQNRSAGSHLGLDRKRMGPMGPASSLRGREISLLV